MNTMDKIAGIEALPLDLLLAFLDARLAGADVVDIAEAAYWVGADCHGGQGDPVYRLTSATGYRPGAAHAGPQSEDAQRIYDLACSVLVGRTR